MQRNPTPLIMDHKNKWESAELLNNYYVVGVIAIPCPGFGVIINIVFKEAIHIPGHNWQHFACTCLDVTKMIS